MKKTSIYKLICMLLVICLAISVNSTNAKAENNSNSKSEVGTFSGTKEITYTIKETDMKNYCNSGREGFQHALRKELPDGVNYELSQVDKQITFTLIISFNNFDEYYELHKKMLGEEISIKYGAGKDVSLWESFDYTAISGYLDTLLRDKSICFEKDFSWFATYVGTELNINDVIYECNDVVDIKGDNIADILYEYVSIKVDRKKDDVVATVHARVSERDHTEDQYGEFKYQLKKNDKITCTEEGGKLYIDFVITSPLLDEALSEIGTWLGMHISVERTYEYVDMATVAVVENINILYEQVMVENGELKYESNLIGWHKGLDSSNENIDIEDYRLYACNIPNIEYKYHKDMKLENLYVTTDFSDTWGKYKRTIEYQLPIDLALPYNEAIVEYIKSNMSDGMACEVSDIVIDDIRYRNYEITIVSADSKDIEKFTQQYLGARSQFIIRDGFALFGKHTLIDVIKVNEQLLGMSGVENVVVKYKIGVEEETADSKGILDKYQEFSFEYRLVKTQTWMAFGIVVLAAIILAVYIWILVKKIKNKIAKNKAAKVSQEQIMLEEPIELIQQVELSEHVKIDMSTNQEETEVIE